MTVTIKTHTAWSRETLDERMQFVTVSLCRLLASVIYSAVKMSSTCWRVESGMSVIFPDLTEHRHETLWHMYTFLFEPPLQI